MICRDLQADPVDLSCQYATKKKTIGFCLQKNGRQFLNKKKINENFFNKE